MRVECGTGDENPNQIAIEVDSDEVQVVGLDGEAINGTDEVSFKNVTGIKLRMKKGMDSVSIQNVSLDKLKIDLGHGSDEAEIKNSVIGALKIFGRKIKSITKTNLIDIQNVMANKLILRGDDDIDANITESDLGKFRFAVGFAGVFSRLRIDDSDINSFPMQTFSSSIFSLVALYCDSKSFFSLRKLSSTSLKILSAVLLLMCPFACLPF